MSYGTSVPTAKDAVVTTLTARGGLSGVPVLREYPKDPADIRDSSGAYDAVWVGRDGGQNVTGSTVVPVFKASPVILHETYTLWVTFQSFKPTSSGTQEAATERAWTLSAELVGAVSSDPTLGVATSSALPLFCCGLDGEMFEFEESTGRLEQGYGCQVLVGLHVTARTAIS